MDREVNFFHGQKDGAVNFIIRLPRRWPTSPEAEGKLLLLVPRVPPKGCTCAAPTSRAHVAHIVQKTTKAPAGE
jgi:hypothetical protein